MVAGVFTLITNLSVFTTIVISISFIKRSESQKLIFRPVKDFEGSSLCAVDDASSSAFIDDIVGIEAGVPRTARCAFYCTELNRRAKCWGFNYLERGQAASSQCQFFNAAPVACRYTLNCSYFQVREQLFNALWFQVTNAPRVFDR